MVYLLKNKSDLKTDVRFGISAVDYLETLPRNNF
jgi:hypothetical protein